MRCISIESFIKYVHTFVTCSSDTVIHKYPRIARNLYILRNCLRNILDVFADAHTVVTDPVGDLPSLVGVLATTRLPQAEHTVLYCMLRHRHPAIPPVIYKYSGSARK